MNNNYESDIFSSRYRRQTVKIYVHLGSTMFNIIYVDTCFNELVRNGLKLTRPVAAKAKSNHLPGEWSPRGGEIVNLSDEESIDTTDTSP